MNNLDTKLKLATLADEIKVWSKEFGFSQLGITDIDLKKDKDYLKKWLDNGFHGSMKYMESHGSKRGHPEELVKGTKRVISVSMDYLPKEYNGKDLLSNNKKGLVSGYARGRDYHKLMRSRLKKLANKIKAHSPHENRVFVDSAPVLEKALAQKAGLGWIGKNTLLINKKMGSYFFLGEIYTDLELPIDKPADTSHCGTCTNCMDVCPTKAFKGPNQLDARKCISYLTIEHKGSIDKKLRPLMGNRVFGCDDCQIFCPWNKFAQYTSEDDFQPRHGLDNSDLIDLFMWTEEEFLKKTEGSPIRRAGYLGWLRNLAIGLGNSESSKNVTDALSSRQEHPSDMVREHVKWALQEHIRREKP